MKDVISKLRNGCEVEFRDVSYRYRYCSRCRREWPAKHASCPQCVLWLGDEPLERIERQIVPRSPEASAPHRYEVVSASALVLRLVSGAPPTNGEAAEIAQIVKGLIITAPEEYKVCGVAGHGWLIHSPGGPRSSFRFACELERRLIAACARLEATLQYCGAVRWGIWTDQYLVAFDQADQLAIPAITAPAIFGFEPDNIFCCAEVIYQANRQWEHFVCAPHRLLDDGDEYGYRIVGHKRPSALDHGQVEDLSPFTGREPELSAINQCWQDHSQNRICAIIAEAGSGKSRLIREWLARHSERRALKATFSLFGGTVADFAAQLAELPEDRLDPDSLLNAVVERIDREKIVILVMDDLHWADHDGIAFLHRLLAAPRIAPLMVILAARPSATDRIGQFTPTTRLFLRPLPTADAQDLAHRLITSNSVAAIACQRSDGNPLFIEHFSAWASESGFRGGGDGPYNLHQLIAARIDYLANVRMKEIKLRLRWGDAWERKKIGEDLDKLETDIGLWLDRLETGDYADRVEVAQYIVQLECLNFEIVIASNLAHCPRSRSNRLLDAIERLFTGSAEEILHYLEQRAANPFAKSRHGDIAREAERAGDIVSSVFNWSLAQKFYELSFSLGSQPRPDIVNRLQQCRLHNRPVIERDIDVVAGAGNLDFVRRPNVGPLQLPYIWIGLAEIYRSSLYYHRAAEAAVAINDKALGEWAQRKALAIGHSASVPN